SGLKQKTSRTRGFFMPGGTAVTDRPGKAKPPPGKTDYCFGSATTLLPRPRLLYSHMRLKLASFRLRCTFPLSSTEPVLPEKGRLEMAASAHGFATLKPSLITLSRITT